MGTINGLPNLALRCSDTLPLRTTYQQAYDVTRNCSQSSFSVMIAQKMDAVIHFKHSCEEVIDLELAIAPLADSIRRVSSWQCRSSMKKILNGEFFRYKEALSVRDMLLRSVKHSRQTLHEIFPLMQPEVLLQAQTLEDVTRRYWNTFLRLKEETSVRH